MSDKAERVLDFTERAARDGFRSIALRTDFVTPSLAARVLRRLPKGDGFDPEKIASHVERLPEGTGENVVVGRTASQAFLIVSIPRDPRHAFEWAEGLMSGTGASGVKMNFGPGKSTDVKIFWGKPEVNTLIAIGGDEESQ
jgi:hypothetical protein